VTFSPGQVVTVFRSRLRPEAAEAYAGHAAEVLRLALSMPGLVDVKSFSAEDGERVTLVTFADQESHDAWRHHLDHVAAQRKGRSDYYSEYSIQVCSTIRANEFSRRV
jgi:heme-degrading monooxygenase HmoA